MVKNLRKLSLFLLSLFMLGFFLLGNIHLPSVQAAAGDGWTFVDGNLSTGLNNDTVRHAQNPAMLVYNNELYVAWQEMNSSTTQIRVRKYDGSTWSWVDGGGSTGINYDTGQHAIHPNLVVFSGNLYAIWSETYSGVYVTRVKRYDGSSTWTAIDGSVTNGLNKDAVTCGATSGPSFGVNNGYLYAAWVETYSGAGGAYQLHVKRYDSGSTWSFVDGGGFTGLNYDTNRSANKPKLYSLNNTLYLIWTEVNPSNKYIIRVKRYDGATWTTVDGGNGLNYNAGYTVDEARLINYNGSLYAYWLENYFIRMKSYNGSAWSTADSNAGFKQNNLNYAYAESPPAAVPYGNKLYFTWGEDISYDPWSIQTRAAYYYSGAMAFIDGNDWTTGLNYNRVQYAYKQAICEYNGTLYLAWYESNYIANQLRVRSTPLPAVVTSVTNSGNGVYGAGQNFDLYVTFNKAVNVNGTPVIPLTLTSGGVNASYISGSGTATLAFRYTVASGNYDNDGVAVGTGISLAGGTIRDTVNSLDADLSLSNVTSTTGVLVDGAPPTVTSTNPANNGTGVGLNQNLIVYFNENISKGSGKIRIRKYADYSLVEAIDVASTSVTVSTNSATIDPSVTLESETRYYVIIDAGAFTDGVGNNFAGILTYSVWNFLTVDTTPPSGYSVSIDQSYINNNNKTAMSFSFAGAEVGATYNYTLTSDGGGEPVTGSGAIGSATQQVTGVTTFGLNEGTLTLSVTLTDISANTGAPATDTVLKDTLMPNSYSVEIEQAAINISNRTAMSFVISGAETGARYDYTISSSGGGGVTLGGFDTVSTGTSKTVSGIDVSLLSNGTLTVSLTMTDVAGNTGLPVQDTVLKDTVRPSGYNVSIDQAAINNSNITALSFTFGGAEVGATYNYTLSSSGGGTPVTGSGTVSSITQQITGIDTSGLNDGTLTLSVTLTDTAGNTGLAATDTVSRDTIAPSGYSVDFNQSFIRIINQTALSLTITGAEVGTVYYFTIISSGGGTAVNGNGTVTSATQTVTGVNVSGLNDGTLTIGLLLVDPAGNSGSVAMDTVAKDTIAPSLLSVTRMDNTHLAVTLSENCINITKTGTGGFAVSQVGAGMITYAVSEIAQGVDASHVVLTVANMGASGSTGVKVQYTAGTDGTVRDTAGNSLATDSTGVTAPPWDTTPPALVSGVRTNNTRLTVTLSEDCVNLANANNGGFTVEETGNPGKTYAVTATAPGTNASQVVLTVANLKKSGKEGVTVKYTAGGTGIIEDIAGNTMETDSTGLNVPPWDLTPPSIITRSMDASNGFIDITFSEGIYGADTGSSAVNADDFLLTFTANGGTATNAVISSVKKNNSMVEASASALTGNETTIRVFLSITGTPSGVETIEIKPANSSSIYDVAGNATPDTQTTGAVLLNDKVAPTILSVARTNNTHITVTLSEDCINLTKANDGGFTVNQLGAPTITYVVSAITQGASASQVVLTVANMAVSAREGVKVKYTAGTNGTIQDIAGNPMATPAAGFNLAGWDTIAPTIVSGSTVASNSFLDVNFSEGIYAASNGTGPITTADLALAFNANGGTATNVTISSVKKNNSASEGSASPLTGGETSIRVFLSVTGTPSGVESIEIKPFDGVSIYDRAGNTALATETTGPKNLNDKTPPTIVSVVRTDNTHLLVTLSEDCINITKANNGGFTVNQLGNGTIIYTVSAIAQGVDAHHVILTVADMGASAAAGVKVKYTAGTNGTIQDLAGNSMATPPAGFNILAWGGLD